MKLLRILSAAFLVFSSFPASPDAETVFSITEGYYSDNFTDETGLSLIKNIKTGHPLQPGAKVSLLEWCWKQPYSEDSETLHTPFSDRGAVMNMTEVVNTTGDASGEIVHLWERKFGAGSQLTLAPSVSSTDLGPRKNRIGDFAYRPALEEITGEFMARGPYQTGLPARENFTTTFKAFFCDDPQCNRDVNPVNNIGLDVGTLDVFHGIRLASFDIKLRTYSDGGSFNAEYSISPFTLEFKVPDPLPAWKGFEYRTQISMQAEGQVSCSPLCTATLWLDSVRVMAKGHPIVYKDYVCDEDCPEGTRACGPDCVADYLPCGADTATYYVGSGSYLSPIFDSLSENTVWTRVLWEVNQNSILVPKTPIGIKWRVGNGTDPSVWLADPTWFTWTMPMLATDVADDCQPGFMEETGEYPIFADGDESKALTGRYFQYEVDFTGQYANERYPPETDFPYVRQFFDPKQPELTSMEVCYAPAAGQIISNSVCAAQLKNWTRVTYEADLTKGGSIRVDVLDKNNVPLFSNVPSGFSLVGLNSKEYPCLRLRAIIDNEGDPNKIPRLRSWRLDWDVIATPLQLDRNSISLKTRSPVTVTVVLPVLYEGALTVHDASGQLIKEIYQGSIGAGLHNWTWDGTNQKGHAVAPGVYFVTLRAGDIRRVRTIAVMP